MGRLFNRGFNAGAPGANRGRHRRRRNTRVAFALLAATTLVAAACTQPAPGGGGGPRQVNVIAPTTSIAHGSPIGAIEPAYVNLEPGQLAPDTPATCTTTATSTSAPGDYPTTCSGAAHPGQEFNYFDGTITITPAEVTVTASSSTNEVGDGVAPVTASYAGLQNGETEPDVLATCSTTATSTSPVDTYPTTCSGAADPNYAFTYIDGTVDITPAAVNVTASSGSTTYGDAVAPVSPSYSGFKLGESTPATGATCSTPADSSSDVGSYPTTCSGAADPNYTFSYVDGSHTVTPAGATITASSASFETGSAVPPVTPIYSGLTNGDTAASTAPNCSTTATSGSAPGNYPSTCSGAADVNYTFGYTDGTYTVTAAAPVTVTASTETITYGDAIPAITAGYVGFGGGQSVPAGTQATCSTTATAASPAGVYPTTCTGATDPNYSFVYVPGTVTIQKAQVSVTASSESMTYGGAVPAISPSYSGLVNGDVAPATAPACSTTATSASPVGTYPSTCAGAADPNYAFSYTDGTVTVTDPPPSGWAAYGSEPSSVTSVAAGSNGNSVGASTIQVASGTGAGFDTYTNLTIDTSNGPQPAFCKSIGATSMGTCSSVGSGTVSTGGYVTDASMTTFDVYSIIPGGAAAVEPSSVTVVTDVPAAQRGIPTHVDADASLGLLKFVPSSTASGEFSLTFGYCDTGTATYSGGDPSCETGTITYGPTVVQTMGDQVQVSIITQNIYQRVGAAVDAPATIPQGSTFTASMAAGPASLPARQPTGTFLGDAIVSGGNNILAVLPVPDGMTFVGAELQGGDALTAGNAVITYCPTTSSPGCIAQTGAKYSNTTAPYVQLSLPGVTIPGGGTATVPSAVVTLTASGPVGTQSAVHLSEFSLNTATNLGSAFFHGYPSDPAQPNTNPPTFPATDLAVTEIT